jgi:hypothetical protein
MSPPFFLPLLNSGFYITQCTLAFSDELFLLQKMGNKMSHDLDPWGWKVMSH